MYVCVCFLFLLLLTISHIPPQSQLHPPFVVSCLIFFVLGSVLTWLVVFSFVSFHFLYLIFNLTDFTGDSKSSTSRGFN